jgi:hypothetical protein
VKNIWEMLGTVPTKDIALIKKAFSERSKEVHPEEHPEEFMELKTAYRMACAHAVDDELFPFLDFVAPEEEVDFPDVDEEKENLVLFETMLVQTLKESEPTLLRFSKVLWKRTRRNGRLKKFFRSNDYIGYRENRVFIEIFTDYICYYAEQREFCKTLMSELKRIQDGLSDNLYIYENIKYIKLGQQKFQKPFWSPYLIYSVVTPIVMFSILSLFIGMEIFIIMATFYAPVLLIVVIYKIIFKYS